jgi:hypothetical protein
MHDALEELSDLSDVLQKGDITLAKANRKIERQIEIFRCRKDNPGSFYKDALDAVADGHFRGVPLSNAGKGEREINCKQFYQGLVDSMSSRLMSADDKKLRDLTSITQSEIYESHQFAPDHGEIELRELCTRFNLSFAMMKDAFREFKETKGAVVTPDFQKLLFAIDTIPVSTAACERGFSAMNNICSPLRSLLTVSHISSCMFIHIVGPPLTVWNPQPYVRSWLAKDRRDATSLHGMARTVKVASLEGRSSVWKVFE